MELAHAGSRPQTVKAMSSRLIPIGAVACLIAGATFFAFSESANAPTQGLAASASTSGAPTTDTDAAAPSQLAPAAMDMSNRSEVDLESESVVAIDSAVSSDDNWGHPEFGHYKNESRFRNALLARAAVAINKGNTAEEKEAAWLSTQTSWEIPGGRSKQIPLEYLGFSGRLTDEQHGILSEALAPLEATIRDESLFAMEQMRLAAEEYVYSRVIKLPRGESYEPDYGEENELAGQYTALSSLDAGVWTYVIDFRSHDFPALEDVLVRLKALRQERESLARSTLDGFL